ncbi:MAG TPA: polysaccharide deacetylase family protein [Longimicrobiales bacterium]
MSRWKRRLKAAFGWLIFHTGVYKPFFRNRALVLVFHRVDDRFEGDPISCTEAEFDRFCRFIGRFFRVVGLGELLDRIEAGADLGRLAVITFDDGYEDNHRTVRHRLRRYGLPACFFISPGFIGTDRVPWWDAHHAIPTEWMTWDDVRDLHQDGFEIGAHTLTHIDLGVASHADAIKEIAGSKARIEAELDTAVTLFSYPFGGPERITEASRDIVRRAGFRCCAATFGGAVRPDSDPFRLPRIAMSPWFLSPYQFGFEVLSD